MKKLICLASMILFPAMAMAATHADLVPSHLFPAMATIQKVAAPAGKQNVVTPQVIQGYIAHAEPAKALGVLTPILKADPGSAKAWYLEAEALDALGHDHKAKVALGTAEHLDPAMPFANPRSLSGLEHRVGLSNVQASKSRSELFNVLFWLLLLALLMGAGREAGVYVYLRRGRRKVESAAESARQNVLLAITEFLTGEMNAARISADARGDAVRLASIQGWQKSLVDCAQGLKDVAKADLDPKRAVTKRCEHLLTEIRAEMVGQAAIPSVSGGGGNQGESDGLGELWPDNSAIVAERRGLAGGNSPAGGNSIAPVTPAYIAPSQTILYQSGNTGGGSAFDSALEEGLGMGIGMEIAEDLMGGNRDSSSGSGFGGDNNGNDDPVFQSGPDDAADPSQGGSPSSGWDNTDDGLSSGSSFGGTDDGFTGGDDSGSADDGFTGSSDDWS